MMDLRNFKLSSSVNFIIQCFLKYHRSIDNCTFAQELSHFKSVSVLYFAGKVNSLFCLFFIYDLVLGITCFFLIKITLIILNFSWLQMF